jgi:hypothetical protein
MHNKRSSYASDVFKHRGNSHALISENDKKIICSGVFFFKNSFSIESNMLFYAIENMHGVSSSAPVQFKSVTPPFHLLTQCAI